MTTLFAQSYANGMVGFYFENYDEYSELMQGLEAQGHEEVEIQFIDGEPEQAKLFEAAGITQTSVQLWYEELDDLRTVETLQLVYLLNCGYSLEEALEKHSEVIIHFGSASDYAQELTEETSEIPQHLVNYIDYEAIARDMEISGEIIELDHQIYVVNALEF